jgi:hypothetical protein
MKYKILSVSLVHPTNLRSDTLRSLAKESASLAFCVRAEDVLVPFEVVCLPVDVKIAVAHGSLVAIKDALAGELWTNEVRRVVDECLAWWREE